MQWTEAMDREELVEKGRAIFKQGARQLALFHQEGEFFAVDNRCPHQGFPLLKGSVDGEARLTCNWHNWKFDLRSGSCVLGADNVRAYPVRIEGGKVLVDLADPTPEEVEAQLLEDLGVAFGKRQYGRMARELTRLVFHGRDPLVALRRALGWVRERLEFGTTHAHAVCADWIRLYQETPEGDREARLAFLTEALDHLAHDALRHAEYPFPDEVLPWDPQAFAAAVEAEDEEAAVGRVRGALGEGLTWGDLEPALAAAALRHYNDFGHSLIYVQKSGELVGLLGPEVLEDVLLPLVRSLCFATREDLVPRFAAYAEVREGFPEASDGGRGPWEATEIQGKGVAGALRHVREAVRDHAPREVFDGLVRVNARNLLRFDTSYHFAYDRPTPEHVGWLDFTHALTFADAVRVLCGRYPDLWPDGLLQLACFAGRNHGFLLEDLDEERWKEGSEEELAEEARTLALDHGQGLPIYAAHLVKTWRAVESLGLSLSPGARELALAGLRRFLRSPLKQKHVRRVVREALWLVGKDFPEGPLSASGEQIPV